MDLTRVFDSPHALHAASVHVPMCLALLGLPLMIFVMVSARRRPNARVLGSAFFFMAALTAAGAVVTGRDAASELVALASDEIASVVTQHRLLGYAVAALSLVTSVFLIVSRIRARSGDKLFTGLAALGATALFVLVLYVGSSGGRLVYGYGIGTPVAGADGVSGATVIVGANPVTSLPGIPHVPTAHDESLNAIYTPKTLPIDPAQAAAVTFAEDVMPLLQKHCVECHGGGETKAGLDLSTHAGILEGGDYAGPAVIAGDPDGSAIVRHIRGIYTPKMPKDKEELADEELHVLRMWIAAGAKGE